jgi:hypothetical protein
METAAEASSVPRAIITTVQADKEVRKSDVSRCYKREAWAAVEKGKIANRHDITYVVRTFRKDAEREYRFDGRGKLLNQPTWQATAEDDDDEEDDDDDDEDDD